jgi:chromosome segregation ATPase
MSIDLARLDALQREFEDAMVTRTGTCEQMQAKQAARHAARTKVEDLTRTLATVWHGEAHAQRELKQKAEAELATAQLELGAAEEAAAGAKVADDLACKRTSDLNGLLGRCCDYARVSRDKLSARKAAAP